ncbi:hypothetical protein ALNOE001_22090 [Candidatus Methanobinarius endosymbioticus]|uniref:Peptidase C39 domain-containing protein n=1 Tax=Candidatus Methanobinarius endosymbioticus TaxID=2006182 RepID=A0A366M881_9EURY|nr:hypothetical protein ALNOE001_22090 [Candidatus Methanobinarius endosymbioticus]
MILGNVTAAENNRENAEKIILDNAHDIEHIGENDTLKANERKSNCGIDFLVMVAEELNITIPSEHIEKFNMKFSDKISMQDLIEISKEERRNAEGVKLPSRQLEKNNIVYLSLNDFGHFSVIYEVNDNNIILLDPENGFNII